MAGDHDDDDDDDDDDEVANTLDDFLNGWITIMIYHGNAPQLLLS